MMRLLCVWWVILVWIKKKKKKIITRINLHPCKYTYKNPNYFTRRRNNNNTFHGHVGVYHQWYSFCCAIDITNFFFFCYDIIFKGNNNRLKILRYARDTLKTVL